MTGNVTRLSPAACGQEAYPTLAGKAAALVYPLAGNHALVDGNKRLASASHRAGEAARGGR